MMDDYLEMIHEIMPEGWSTDADIYGPLDCTFICPCGIQIEADGRCPNGCVSPLRQHGLI